MTQISPSKADNEAMALYIALMEEAKGRAASINRMTNFPNGLPPTLIREYSLLQIRMLCEIVALGCLVAHGDITSKTRSLQEIYQADKIFSRLEKLHPNFYPVPFDPQFSENNSGLHLGVFNKPYMTKAELPRVYAKCSDELHKGKLKRLLKQRPPRADFFDIGEWGQKILNLLSAHRISRIGNNFHFIAFLEVARLGGMVQVAIAQSPTESAR